MTKAIDKAWRWLNDKHNGYYPVAVNRRGYAEFIAYVFILKLDTGRKIYYLGIMQEINGEKRNGPIKRICI